MQDNKEQINILSKKIEAVLFYLNDSVTLKDLEKYLKVSKEEISEALNLLEKDLDNRGIVLLQNGDEISFGTAPMFSFLIEEISKEELNKDLSQASLDTLSIILYKSPITKKEIEYIRGVNSSFSIRNLLIRGLIERESSKLDERVYMYKPSTELFSYLGISKIEQMPQWKDLQDELSNILNQDIKKDGFSNEDSLDE